MKNDKKEGDEKERDMKENDNKENGTKVDKEDQMKRYYVDFYDMFDGWGTFGFSTDNLSDDLQEAIKKCDRLNSELAKGNKDCGEHYGVIDSQVNREVYCGQDGAYKEKISNMIPDLVDHLRGVVKE